MVQDLSDSQGEEKVGLAQLNQERIKFLLDQLLGIIPYVKELTGMTEEARKAVEQQVAEFALSIKTSKLDKDQLEAFFKKPYYLEPVHGRPDSWYLIIPKFVDIQIGWLDRSTESYNRFLINRYMDWLGEIPEAIKKQLNWKAPPELLLDGEELHGPKGALEYAWQKYRPFLHDRGENRIKINPKRAFDLITSMIKDGVLPFSIKPVDKTDYAERKCDFQLREYQQHAWNEFLRFSAIGVFIPPGTGKTFIALWAMTHLKPPHLVVVPTRLLQEQWIERILAHTDLQPSEYEVLTYQSAISKASTKTWTTLLVDECLPYSSKILLADGSEKLIGEIVENKLSVKVLSMNLKTGEIEPKEVTYYHKIPLHEPLVTINHDDGMLTCTSDHKIYTLNRGYVQAKSLNENDLLVSGKVLHSGLPMRSMQERVFHSPSVRRAPCNRAQLQSPTGKGFENQTKKTRPLQVAGEKVQRRTERFQKSELDGAIKHCAFGNSVSDYLGKSIRGYGDSTEKSNMQRSIRCSPIVKASSVCHVEIPQLTKFGKHAPKRKQKWRLWRKDSRFFQSLLSFSFKHLRFSEKRWRDNGYRSLVERNNFADGSCSLVPRRWVIWERFTNNFFSRVWKRGESAFIRLVASAMGSQNDCGLQQGLLSADEQRSFNKVCGFDSANSENNSVNDLQGWVYDIEIGDNHNFFADDVLVSNCQHLPANTFVKLSLIRRKYTIGLSGSPMREDGREEYIFALTGKPCGLSWDYFKKLNLIKSPTCNVWIVKNFEAKLRRLASLLQVDLRTIIFSDSLETGKAVAGRFKIPFAYGATKDNMDTILANRVAVVSRVGDEGISLPDIERVIEVSFLGGSRRQELQRTTRLLHSEQGTQESHVLMTLEEYLHDRKRLFSIMDKGFKIVLHREGVSEKVIEDHSQDYRPAPSARPRPNSKHASTLEPAVAPHLPISPGQSGTYTSLPGVQRIMALMNKKQRQFYTLLLDHDGEWFSRQRLPMLLGYAGESGGFKATLDFPKLVQRGWIEQKREGNGTSYRTNMKGKMGG